MKESFNSIHSYGITHFIFMIIKQDLFRKDNFDCCSKLLTLIMTIIILLKDKCKLIEYCEAQARVRQGLSRVGQ